MRALILLLAWLAWVAPALASPLNMVGVNSTPVAASYVGLGDLIGATNWEFYFDTRCFTKAYSGSMFTVADSHSTHTTTVGCTGAGDGSFSVSGSPADSLSTLVADCNSAHAYCTLNTLTDQTLGAKCAGACDLNAGATKAQIISNCPGFTRSNSASPPFCVVEVNATAAYTPAGTPPTVAPPFSMISLSTQTAGSGVDVPFSVGDPPYQTYNSQTLGCSNGTEQRFATTLNAWVVLACTMSNTAGLIQFNNTVKGSGLALGTSSAGSNIQLPLTIDTTDTIDMTGGWLLSGDQHASYSALYSNESAYWGGF